MVSQEISLLKPETKIPIKTKLQQAGLNETKGNGHQQKRSKRK